MGKKRRTFSGAEKAKIVLEALKERQTLSEIAQKFEVHPVQVSSWKKEAQEHLGELFSDKWSRDKEQEAQTELVERLYQQIGQLQVELNWLKKKIGQTQQW
jgi:transposase